MDGYATSVEHICLFFIIFVGNYNLIDNNGKP